MKRDSLMDEESVIISSTQGEKSQKTFLFISSPYNQSNVLFQKIKEKVEAVMHSGLRAFTVPEELRCTVVKQYFNGSSYVFVGGGGQLICLMIP